MRSNSPSSHELAHAAVEAISLLHQSHIYADQMKRSPWDFAIRIGILKATKVTENDLRFLVHQGLIEHATEIRPQPGAWRSFERSERPRFIAQTAFILTKAGVELAGSLLSSSPEIREHGRAAVSGPHLAESRIVPRWDPSRRRFLAGEVIIKEFRQPAPGQICVLAAFEEDQWVHRIDDPLPSVPGQDAKPGSTRLTLPDFLSEKHFFQRRLVPASFFAPRINASF
jgi:hypothetical protein